MRISQLISESRIDPDLSARSKTGVLESLSGILARDLPDSDAKDIFAVLQERERLGTTGIGNGTAIPHGRRDELSAPIAALGRSVQGIDFNAMDGKPVHLFVALLSPASSSVSHLKALSLISRLLRNHSLRKRLLAADNAVTLFNTLVDGEDT